MPALNSEDFVGVFHEKFQQLDPKPALEANLVLTDTKVGQMRDRDIPRIEDDIKQLKGEMKQIKDGVHSSFATKLDIVQVQADIRSIAADVKALTNGFNSFLELYKREQADLEVYKQELKGEISGVKGEISGVKGEISGVKGEISGVKGEISGVKAEIGGIKAEIGGITAEIGGIKAEIGGIRDDLKGLVLKVDENTADIKTLMVTTSKSHGILMLVKEAFGLKNKTFAEGCGLMFTRLIEVLQFFSGQPEQPAVGR